MKARPLKGEGKRDLNCRNYEGCLDVAGLKNWKTWNCEQCDVFRIFFGTEKMDQKEENKRICEECRTRPTITPKHALCPVCLGAKAKKAKKAITDKARPKNSQNVPKRGHTITIQITIPDALLGFISQRR